VESKNPKFKKNQFVISFLPWVLYQVNDGSKIQVLPEGIPPSYFLGVIN
jgi:NADPH-dependent curcumin reductase CurA